jgi:hypothetical protein
LIWPRASRPSKPFTRRLSVKWQPTALAGIPVLVTCDADLFDIEEISLRIQFEESDLPPVQICHPKLLLKAVLSKR